MIPARVPGGLGGILRTRVYLRGKKKGNERGQPRGKKKMKNIKKKQGPMRIISRKIWITQRGV